MTLAKAVQMPLRSHGTVFVMLFVLVLKTQAQFLALPQRASDAVHASDIIRTLASLDFTNREQEIVSQVLAGNVPSFYRRLCAISITNTLSSRMDWATFHVAPEYLAVGSDEDYFLTPLSPVTAQRLADRLGCTLPTRKMVDAIYAAADVKLAPAPMPPGPQMITVPRFAEHNAILWTQRLALTAAHPLGALVAGHKKDVVITPQLTNAPGKVAIYGWHQTNGRPIQPLYLGHRADWVDYSHGVRLIQQQMTVNGVVRTVAEVLADPQLCGLLSDEGVIPGPGYQAHALPSVPAAKRKLRPSGVPPKVEFTDFKPTGNYDEISTSFVFDPEVKVHINAPARENFGAAKPVMLIVYALPNGNTTEQTIGRNLKPGDDWHFNIQHIGAQTRWLRERLKDRTIVVAYLEAAMKSWPAWRRKYGDDKIPEVLDAVNNIFDEYRVEVVLASHSGGGSLIFGYLNSVTNISPEITRVVFLDSNYAYNSSNHLAKLVRWLKGARANSLSVFAYDDANALLDGKPFVSAENGTWGRSRTMLNDLRASFAFTSRTNSGLETYSALAGRLQLLLQQNPERKVLHTVQVERNGLIHGLLLGTAGESRGYEYFGERAYTNWIAPAP